MTTASAPTTTASIAGGPYSLSQRAERGSCGATWSSASTRSASTSAAAAELTITGISESRHDEGVVVELVVDRARDHVQVESLVAQALDPFRSRQRTDDDDRDGGIARGEQRHRVHERAARCQHRIDHDHRPAGERLGELVDVRMGLERLLIARDADEADVRVGHQLLG